MEDALFQVVLHEARTGIVLKEPGVYAVNLKAKDVGRRFEALDEARAFAERTIAMYPDVECSIVDEEGNPVEVLRYVRILVQEVRPPLPPASRWERWTARFRKRPARRS